MPHELTEIDGEHSFVFNEERGYPWHRLGTPFKGFMTAEQALQESKCNDNVTLQPVYIIDADAELLEIPERFATVSDIYGPMGVVSEKFEITQCFELLAIAYSIVDASDDEASIDTMGRLGKQGERFFCHIEFPELIVDPQGVADKIRRGLFVGTAFDGSMANTLGLSNIREVCANTVRMSLGQLMQAVKVKHTLNVAERMHQAAAAVGYAAAAEKEMVKRAEKMLSIPGPRSMAAVTRTLWPIAEDATQKTITRHTNIWDGVWDLYDGPTNSESVGENGWAAYNAAVEWLDYHRPLRGVTGDAATQRRLAQTLMDDTHDVNQKKFRAAEAIFALAG